ncbi:PAS/PAC sensor signal transduction histidine kinase [Haloterrigena salina JCM 13891]|uniref:histidine kinase n=1 Tax=Haloterrigena salina JCM 13891 TaxID=1227488 RepID=M0C1F5_9EURY|nr:PAS domain S-box protein [Haloterrigena salina]ELZ17020.1 PAS/PAC sensor signal transduction histidine kinase [Haloterrigena salina JCM 13891]
MKTSDSPSGITIDDVRRFFTQLDQPETPVSVEEVTSELDCTPQTARGYLEDLTEQGELRTKRIDGSTRVWWSTESGGVDRHDPDSEQLSAFVREVKDYAIFMLDPEGTVVSWNEGAKRIKGYSASEIIGQHFSAFYTKDDIATDVPERNLERAAAEGRVEDEGWRIRKDGSRFWANVTITAIRDDGELRGFTKVTRDMTERREYEQQLEKQADQLERRRTELEQELDEVFERIDDAFYALDDEFRYEYVNEHAEEHFGEPAGKLIGQKPWKALGVDKSDPIFERFDEALATQEPLRFERYSEPLGIWAMVRIYPSESGLSVYFEDITQRKERERELERVYDLLERAEHIADVGGWEIDPDTRDVFWTDHLFEILEIPSDEEPPLDEALDVYLDDDRPNVERAIDEAVQSGTSFDIETRYRTPTGEVRWLRVIGEPDIEDGAVVSLRGAAQDITEQKERERELQQIRDRMEFALNATDSIVWDWNVDENQTSFYPSAESLYGTAVETWDDFIEIVHPDDREQTEEKIRKSLETGEPKEEEIRIDRNGEKRWIEAPGRPIEDEDGSTRMIGVARDITERKTFEQKLRESNERLEQFAYAASHDLQEPLRMVSSYLQLLDQRYGDELDEDGREYINFAVDGAARMREMIDGLLEYSRVETQGDPFEPITLETVLEDVLDNLQFRIEEHDVEITSEDLPEVEGDASQLRQVFQNLLENAIEYSGDAPPRVHISAERAGNKWVVSVSDDGIGIDPDDQDRIFEIFQRLHSREEHDGTGIGLALCNRIVERHGGEIWIDSEPDDGTTFSFSLPAVENNC